MAVNWARIFNRLWEIINPSEQTAPAYFSGGRFIGTVREIDPYFPDYTQYIDQRRSSGKSTSRKDYFYDILINLSEADRFSLANRLLDAVQEYAPNKVAEVRDELGGIAAVPPARIAEAAWNSERLNRYLQEIDSRIAAANYDGALTLTYTCLEGFLQAFLREHVPGSEIPHELVELAKAVRLHLRGSIRQYPDEALAMVTHIAYMIDRSRNKFSESHFDQQADRWLAVFARDLVNSEIRLLLHFMKQGTANKNT
jgi:hypothetical protein